MAALGNNVHIFARPHRRQDLLWCFDTVLGCGPVDTVEHPGMREPMLLVRFPGGGHLSIEFVEDAPDDDTPRLGAWLELRAEDPQALMQAALDAGLPRVEHPRPSLLLHGPGRPGVHHRPPVIPGMPPHQLPRVAYHRRTDRRMSRWWPARQPLHAARRWEMMPQ